MPHQHESYGKGDAECNDECTDVRAYSNKRKLHYLFVKNEIIADKINEDIQHGITATACQVSERFLIHQCPERRIEKINGIDDQVFQNEGAKVIFILEFAPVGDMPLGKGCTSSFMYSKHLGIEVAHPGELQLIIFGSIIGVFLQLDEQGRLQSKPLVTLFGAHDHGPDPSVFNNIFIPQEMKFPDQAKLAIQPPDQLIGIRQNDNK
jgi:hypothetical protein